MITSPMVGRGDLVSLRCRFCVLTKGGAVGFGGGLAGPNNTREVEEWDRPGGGFCGGGSPCRASWMRGGADIDRIPSEDAGSDKFRGVKKSFQSGEISKVRKVEEAGCDPQPLTTNRTYIHFSG